MQHLVREIRTLRSTWRSWETYYRCGADHRLEQDPDLRIREALSLVFSNLRKIVIVPQLVSWTRQERIDLTVAAYGPHGRTVQSHPPRYNTVYRPRVRRKLKRRKRP
jgi:hypothetical protein